MAPAGESGAARVLAEFAGGTVGGALQALVGQPLDLVKTRLQTAQPGRYAGPADCFAQTLRGEGVRGLFKGVSGPLVLNGAMTAIMFSTNGSCKRAVAWARGKDPTALNFPEQTAAAWMTAPIYCTFLTPVELVKARLQVRVSGADAPYSGPLGCVRHTLAADGVRGLFRGWVPTTAMRIVGSPCYFVSYQFARDWLTDGGRLPTTASTVLQAGGFSGVAFWTVAFPADVIKSRVQTATASGGEAQGPLGAAAAIFREGGLRAFFRGFLPCLVRAPFANAASFYGVEMTLKVCGYTTAF
eukprot:TRINITY_DN62135_c0_g1_i1.p1 TRINITY_DN62135_c0_g1~~TRINITY_DN62135_c0_g1_i1.p1  ORF type:complete len:322 (+),score=50.82 TRINITY_DN62135_c0_g1_i1:70-966(+)